MSDQTSTQLCNELVNQYAPSLSRSMLLQTTAQALGNAAHNATFAQQQHNMIINTSTALNAGMLQAIGVAYAKK